MSNLIPQTQTYTYETHHFVQQGNILQQNEETEQYRPVVQHYQNGVLEVIQESERSSYDNAQNLQDRRQELKESRHIEGEFDYEQDEISHTNSVTIRGMLNKISYLESELIKERASNSAKRAEQLQSYQTENIQGDGHQVDQLRSQLREMETTIQVLTSFGSEETGAVGSNLQLLRQKISDLEERLVKIQLENERLNSIIQKRDQMIERLQSNSQEQFEHIMTEQLNEYMSKAEKLLEENEILSQYNDKLTLNYKELDEQLRTLQLKQSDKTEEIRSFWKDHFEKLSESMQARFDQEKKELQIQMERKTEHTNSIQAQLMLSSGLVQERSQLQSQIDSQILFSKNMDTQIKVPSILLVFSSINYLLTLLNQEYQRTIESTRKDLFDKQKRTLELDNLNSQLQRRVNELEGQNLTQSEQLKQMSRIEGNAHQVINENIRLLEIAERKSEETLLKSKLLESERIGKDALISEMKKSYEARLGAMNNKFSKDRESWALKEKRLLSENQSKNKKMIHLTEDLELIKEERVTLLQKAEHLKITLSINEQLEQTIQVLTSRKNELEGSVAQLVDQNQVLNSSLEARLNELDIWKERNSLSVEEVTLLHGQYSQQISELRLEFQQESTRQREAFETSIDDFQNKMAELADQFNQVEIKKQQDELALQAEFKKKLDIERKRFLIATEQTNLLNAAITDVEEKQASLLGMYENLQRVHERKLNLINSLEDELAKTQVEAQNFNQQNEIAKVQMSGLRRDYDDLKKAHLMLLSQNQRRPNYFESSKEEEEESGQNESSLGKENTNRRQQQASEPSQHDRPSAIRQKLPGQRSPKLFESKERYRNEDGAAIRAAVEQIRIENQNNLRSKMNDYIYYQDPTNSRIISSPLFVQPSYEEAYSQPNHSIRNPFSDSTGGSSQALFPPRHSAPPPLVLSGKSEEKQLQSNEQPQNQQTTKELANYEGLLRDLEYYKQKDDSSSKLLEVLQQENQQLSSQYKELEKKYYSKDDWAVDEYEKNNGEEQNRARSENQRENTHHENNDEQEAQSNYEQSVDGQQEVHNSDQGHEENDYDHPQNEFEGQDGEEEEDYGEMPEDDGYDDEYANEEAD